MLKGIMSGLVLVVRIRFWVRRLGGERGVRYDSVDWKFKLF